MFSRRLGYKIEEWILIFIIIINIFDFFELLDPFWDFIKKIVSWVLVGILFYQVNVSEILFGVKNKIYDLFYVITAFVLSIDGMISYAMVGRNSILSHISNYLVFVKDITVKGPIIVQNVSQAAFNSLQAINLIPNATSNMINYAHLLTMNVSGVNFLFNNVPVSLMPTGLNGALLQIYNSLVPFIDKAQFYGLVIGFSLLFLLALWATFRIPIKKPSFLGIIHEGHASKISGIIIRLLLCFFSLIFFQFFVFNLIMEWLAIAIDAPILMFSMGVILFLIWRGKHFNFEHWIKNVSNGSSVYYAKFIKLFHSWKTALLGVAGLLVLHPLTEVFNFLLPFVFPMRDSLYLSRLGPNHKNLFYLAHLAQSNIINYVIVILVIIAWFFLLTMPAYFWYKIFRVRQDGEKHYPNIKPWVLGLYYSSLVVAWLAPLIRMKQINNYVLIGVDFVTQWSLKTGATKILLIAIGVFALVYALSSLDNRLLMFGSVIINLIFLGFYSYYFFISSFTYYLTAMLTNFGNVLWVIFFIFLLFNLFFYIGSYLFYFYELIKD